MRDMCISGTVAAHEDYHPFLALRSIGDPRRGCAANQALQRGEPAIPAAAPGCASLWSEIELQAVEMAAREPMLRQTIDETVFDAAPARIVSAVLSRRLACGHRAALAILQALVLETLDEDPAVLEFLETDLQAVVGARSRLPFRSARAAPSQGIPRPADPSARAQPVEAGTRGHRPLAVEPGIGHPRRRHPPGGSVGKGVMLDHATGIVIGETAVVEDGVTILQGVTLGATGKHARRSPSQGPAWGSARRRREGARQHRDRPHEPGRRGQRRAPLRARVLHRRRRAGQGGANA